MLVRGGAHDVDQYTDERRIETVLRRECGDLGRWKRINHVSISPWGLYRSYLSVGHALGNSHDAHSEAGDEVAVRPAKVCTLPSAQI